MNQLLPGNQFIKMEENLYSDIKNVTRQTQLFPMKLAYEIQLGINPHTFLIKPE